jgi:cellulose synthase/poly-beta-1,6-N-acetylglucosamine synthase-like glycosyltransferase
LNFSIVIISKDEPKLAATLRALRSHVKDYCATSGAPHPETIVVDASDGRLDDIRQDHPWVRWIDFSPPPHVAVTIPHQRNVGVRASEDDVVVFTDAGCVPQPGWLGRLLAPILDGSEEVTCGPAWTGDNLFSAERDAPVPEYVREAATINLAFRRRVFDSVGEFDERFAYGSDTDFTWRIVDSGARIHYVADAVVEHDWGTFRRRLKRSRQYGAARIRLYHKHRRRLRRMLRDDPVPAVYPLWLLGLPLVLRWRSYLLLLLVPLWRARRRPFPAQVVISHLAEGVGSLEELARLARRAR